MLSSVLAALTCSASAATIVTSVSEIDLGSGWRTASTTDIDGNSQLGTDGYRYVRTGTNPDYQQSLPSYLTSTLTNQNFQGNVNYALVDNAVTGSGTHSSGTFNPGGGMGGTEGDFLSFGALTFSRASLPGETVRIGLMVDNLDNVIFNSHILRLSDGTTNFDVNTTAESGTDNGVPDWYFWDVTNFAAGDQIDVLATRSEGNPAGTSLPATIGAFSFDSIVVPEPRSAALLTFGALAMILRRQRYSA